MWYVVSKPIGSSGCETTRTNHYKYQLSANYSGQATGASHYNYQLSAGSKGLLRPQGAGIGA